VAPQELVRRVERPEDHFELRFVRIDDDLGRVEAEPLPPAGLEPIRVLWADQRDNAATRSHPFKLKDCASLWWDAGTRYGQVSPCVGKGKCIEESSPYLCARASAGKNSSQPQRRLHANEVRCARAEVHSQPAASGCHLDNPPSLDFELRQDAGMNGFGLADGIPELRLELIHHRPEESSTKPHGRFCVAAGGRLSLGGRNGGQILDWQPIDILEAVPLPARGSCSSSLEVIHFYVDLGIWG